MSTPIAADGYRTVMFYKDDHGKRHRVSRLVCEAFNGPPPTPEHQCAHNNGDRLDNRAENLAWKTVLENTDDRRRHGTINRGELNGRAILSESEATYILVSGEQDSNLAKKLGVKPRTVADIRARRSWRHIS